MRHVLSLPLRLALRQTPRLQADQIDGRPLRLDPGIVNLEIRTRQTRRHSRVVIREGEKNRPLVFRLEAAGVAAKPRQDRERPSTTGREIPTAAYVAGGVGVVALGGFGYFALAGRSKETDPHRCAPYCSQGSYDSMKQRYLLADIALGIGVVSLGTAAVIVLTAPAPR